MKGSEMNNFPKLENGMVVVLKMGGAYLVSNGKLLAKEDWFYTGNYTEWRHRGIGTQDVPPYNITKVYSGEHLFSTDLDYYTKTFPDDVLWDKIEQVTILKNKIGELQEELAKLSE